MQKKDVLTGVFFGGCLLDGGRFVDFLEGFEERGDVGFVGIEGDGDRFGRKITNDVLDAFLKSDILHDLIATSLTMQIDGKNDHLFVCLRSRQR